MPFRVCANLSFMFQETSSLLERYHLAKECGFKGVECAFPYQHKIEEVVEAKKSANVEQVLINVFPGDVTKGELGFAALPGKQEQFKDSFNLALNYAKALDCKLYENIYFMIHIMAGTVNEPTEEHAKVYENNLRFASKLLENEGIVGLIEPINCYSVPKYYLNSYEKGYISPLFQHKRVKNRPYHASMARGHIQVAQVPFRNEPNTSGEINYPYVFGLLEELGYQGWIGLEYKPLSSTKQGLGWMQSYNVHT
uniref:Putative hydroxypyruvate isomerase n=1 Tax=Timema monikensis TaxID=170555 RepID=A0A7R9HLR9_9NEOP|nr:unnamed protein product [Timema monikensis]